ncbi:10016_t:CDS:2 [Funneliformis mosseae]|uniref:10016_t:CDS:1 n=1 Tax=Funneliformis mosseae TaxID=27381 RepID=A0A9N8ZG29_FUNMO|nr:10016_t:CDS:2 [Funneliformis mosseae]
MEKVLNGVTQKEASSKRTLSSDKFNPNQLEDNEDEWIINFDEINPDKSTSNISETSQASDSEINISLESSSMWLYFNKNPADVFGYNVCKICSKKYQISTSVSSLRKHLQTHQFQAPTKIQKIKNNITTSYNRQEQNKYDKYLIQ